MGVSQIQQFSTYNDFLKKKKKTSRGGKKNDDVPHLPVSLKGWHTSIPWSQKS